MSSIIKGGRTRNQGIINLSERIPQKVEVEAVYEEVLSIEVNSSHEAQPITSTLIEEKKEELRALDEQIDRKMEAVNQKVNEILSQAFAKANQCQVDAQAQQATILSGAYEQEQQIIHRAEEEAFKIKEEAIKEKQKMLEEVEGEVVETMMTLIQHIISEELTYHPEWLTYVVRKMLQKHEIDEKAVLLVSPNQYELLKANKQKVLDEITKLSEIRMDEHLNDSTCKLITSQGNIEYDVNQGLEKVISELRILKNLS